MKVLTKIKFCPYCNEQVEYKVIRIVHNGELLMCSKCGKKIGEK